jgi:flagellar basal body-associated protein FliL
MVSVKTKTKKIILFALVSTTFILSIGSYTIPQQQAFAQGMFQSESADRDNQSSPSQSPSFTSTTTAADNNQTEQDQKIILDDITIPINSNTQLSLELPDSKITVQPNK